MRNCTAGSQTDLVLFDFLKACDKVSHQKLFGLNRYGIRGPILKWIQAFLSDRTQTVVLENEKSNIVPFTSGVPQGSVLGPILLLIYINDLPDSTKSKVRLFADDTAIYLAVSSLQDAQILQQDLDHLNKWELEWDMEFNPGKCVVIHITRSRTPIPSHYLLHDQVLESLDQNIDKLEMIQRRAARWTLNNYSIYASMTDMLQSLGWRCFEQRRSDSGLCLFYKIIYGLVAIDLPPYFVHLSSILRYSHNLCFRQIQTTVDYYKFYPLTIVRLNRLPSHIALLPTFESFKRAVCAVTHSMSYCCCCCILELPRLFIRGTSPKTLSTGWCLIKVRCW